LRHQYDIAGPADIHGLNRSHTLTGQQASSVQACVRRPSVPGDAEACSTKGSVHWRGAMTTSLDLLYLGGILVAFTGMAIIDWHWKVALFRDPGHTIAVVAITLVVLLLFDISGLLLGVFAAGSRVMGIFLFSRDMPLEEIFLLTFFGYFTLVMLRIHK
jgi:lycopene cyclase domain-containing protein